MKEAPRLFPSTDDGSRATSAYASFIPATIRPFSDGIVPNHIERRKGGEHHAHSTLARRCQPIVGRVAGLVAVRLSITVAFLGDV